MAVPDSLPQRVFLLAYNPDKGRVGMGTHLGAMLRAAALADLYLGGHLSDERGRAIVGTRHSAHGHDHAGAGHRPGHDPVLGMILEQVTGSKPHRWQSWIDSRQRATFKAVRQQLGEGGWARLEPRKVLGLFPTTKITLRDPRVRKELLARVNDALKKPIGRVDRTDAALVAILAAADLTLVLDRRTRRTYRQRIQELTQLSGPVGPALRRSIEDATAG